MVGASGGAQNGALLGALATGLMAIAPLDRLGAQTHHTSVEPSAVDYAFLVVSDMPRAGAFSAEVDAIATAGRRGRHFISADTQFALTYGLTSQLQLAASVQLTKVAIRSVEGAADKRELTFGGFAADLRWQLRERQEGSAGIAIQFSPQWRAVNETASRGRAYGWGTFVAIDQDLIPGRLSGVINLSHEIAVQRFEDSGVWETPVRLGVGLGLVALVSPQLQIGAELRYFRRYDGIEMARFRGQAIYVGPTISAEIDRATRVTFGWQIQAFGRETGRGAPFDLAGFERHQVRLRVAREF
jgi:hypothetical protein